MERIGAAISAPPRKRADFQWVIRYERVGEAVSWFCSRWPDCPSMLIRRLRLLVEGRRKAVNDRTDAVLSLISLLKIYYPQIRHSPSTVGRSIRSGFASTRSSLAFHAESKVRGKLVPSAMTLGVFISHWSAAFIVPIKACSCWAPLPNDKLYGDAEALVDAIGPMRRKSSTSWPVRLTTMTWRPGLLKRVAASSGAKDFNSMPSIFIRTSSR